MKSSADLTSVGGDIIAKVLGIPRRTHSDLVKKKILPPSDRFKRYSLPKSVRSYLQYKLDDAAPASAANEKRRVLKETADKLALANDRMRGRLVCADHFAWALNAISAQLVTNLEALPGRAVAALVSVTDGGLQRDILLGLTRDVRTHLADFFRDFPDAPDGLTDVQKTAIQVLIGIDTHNGENA